MKAPIKYVVVEMPDTEVQVDFLQERTLVAVGLTEDGRVRVVVKVSHGEDASTWDEHEWETPER